MKKGVTKFFDNILAEPGAKKLLGKDGVAVVREEIAKLFKGLPLNTSDNCREFKKRLDKEMNPISKSFLVAGMSAEEVLENLMMFNVAQHIVVGTLMSVIEDKNDVIQSLVEINQQLTDDRE